MESLLQHQFNDKQFTVTRISWGKCTFVTALLIYAIITDVAYLPWRWIWVVQRWKWFTSLWEKIKNKHKPQVNKRLIPNDDWCTDLWPRAHSSARGLGQSRRAGWRPSTRTRARIAYAPVQILHSTRETVETFPNLFTAVCPDVLCVLNAMFPLRPPFYELPQDTERHLWWLCFKHTNIFTNSQRCIDFFDTSLPLRFVCS